MYVLRVGILTPVSLSETDGTTVRIKRIIPFVSESYPTLVFCPGIEGEQLTDLAGTPVITFVLKRRGTHWNPIKLLHANARLLSELLRNRIDLVYGPAVYFLPALFFSRLLGVKFVYEAHALAYREVLQSSKFMAALWFINEFMLAKIASSVAGLSKSTVTFFSPMNHKVTLVPVFVNLKLYRFNRVQDHESTSKRVGLIGPFRGMYNGPQLDFLLANLERFDSRIRFVLIGDSDSGNNDSRIVNLGFIEREVDYAKALSELDALIVPVKYGSWGPKNKILEAMASGLPVIATPEAILGLDFAIPGVNILVFPENDFVEETNSVLFAERLFAIASAGRKMVEEYYSEDLCRSILTGLLEDTYKRTL